MWKIHLLRTLLQESINNIDAGHSNLDEDQISDLCDMYSKFTSPEYRYSKYAACEYLRISRATLDNHVRNGDVNIRINSVGGFKEKYFYKRDLDALKEFRQLHPETRGRKKKNEHT